MGVFWSVSFLIVCGILTVDCRHTPDWDESEFTAGQWVRPPWGRSDYGLTRGDFSGATCRLRGCP